jgi:hypothetical protein
MNFKKKGHIYSRSFAFLCDVPKFIATDELLGQWRRLKRLCGERVRRERGTINGHFPKMDLKENRNAYSAFFRCVVWKHLFASPWSHGNVNNVLGYLWGSLFFCNVIKSQVFSQGWWLAQ